MAWCWCTIFSTCAALANSFRFADESSSNHLVTDATASVQATAERLQQPTCQYSQVVSAQVDHGYPRDSSMVGVCPAGAAREKCLKRSQGRWQLESFEPSSNDTLGPGIADCQQLCDRNAFMNKPGRGGGCLGYVVRKDFGNRAALGGVQCWLIHGQATMAQAYPDEVKMDNLKHKSRITYFKEYCNCRVRFIHFPRHKDATDLQISYHRLRRLETLKNTHLADNTSLSVLKKSIQEVQDEIALGEQVKLRRARLDTFEGLYDWVPIRIPHRKRKGNELVMPTTFVQWYLGLNFNGQKAMKYWEAPVRIRHVFKKQDFSAFLYLCLDKRTGEEAWYLATQNDPLAWITGRFSQFSNTTLKQLTSELSGQKAMVMQIFFQLECIGTKISQNNEVSYDVEGETAVKDVVDPDFFLAQNRSLTPQGCFSNLKDAEEKQEMKVVDEVGKCPVEQLTSEGSARNGTIGMTTFLKSDANIMDKIGALQNILEKKRLLSIGLGAAKLYTRVRGFMKSDKANASKQLHEFEAKELQAMISRTRVLLEGLSHMFVAMKAVSNTDDSQLKLVCSKELLEHVFEIGGLLPKISQNLAMRPDLVPDDFVRNKLKETQNNNPVRSRSETMEYLMQQTPRIELGGAHGQVNLTDVLEYFKPLSAGSVGQVDLFKVRTDIPADLRAAVMALLPPGSSGTLIVKSVFEDTKEEYMADWNLLELFFTSMDSKLDPKIKVIWKILEPMKTSIFDEFDLRKEAEFTMRGKAILQEFTANIDKGLYKETLPVGSLKLTTPVAIATSSPYVLIQSLASGVPLKNHLEASSGQMERLIEWKDRIYSAILMVYGLMVVKHGFFQSDPHNGNWFWDAASRTITLIDWGGVGQLEQDTHCRLANLYNSMGALQNDWDVCEAVTVQGPGVSGLYKRNGISIFDAGPNEPALIMGKTYELSYKNEETGLQLWYDGKSWVISKENLGDSELLSKVAEFQTPISKITEMGEKGPQQWTVGDHKQSVLVSTIKQCGTTSRQEAYAMAGKFMGIELTLTCPPERIVTFPEGPITQSAAADWQDNGRLSVRCIQTTEDADFIKWGLHNPLHLMVYTDNDGTRYVILPVDGGRRHNLDDTPMGAARAAIWTEEAFSSESRRQLQKLSAGKKAMVLATAEATLATSASLYDSDMVTAAVQGLASRDMIGLLSAEVPDEYVLLGRCILVFHGMLGDVVKDSFMRLVPQHYLQWMLQSNGARFFKSWSAPAREYLAENSNQCRDAKWGALSR